LRGPVTTHVPASLLQLHPDATIVLDRAAAARL
jgi:6-phosphogluconolactonase/glucosamine-6-phosphate isomerase/deaminase